MKVLRAARLFPGTGDPMIADAVVHVEGSRLAYAGPAADAPPVSDPQTERLDLGDRTLLPGLIDCHVHPLSPFHPTKPEMTQAWADEFKLLSSVRSLERALQAGITTFRDCGAPHLTGYFLRDAVEQGVIVGPRMVVAGPAMCPTGGHGWSAGGECDGADGVRRKARELLKQGSDFLKLTATGGGTKNTSRHRATFTVDELRAAAQEADQRDTYATAHCHGIEGIERCVEAGVQMLEHATFVGRDGKERFDADLAQRIRDRGMVVVPTVQVHGRWTETREGRWDELSEADRAVWNDRSQSFYRRVELVGQLYNAGVELLLGSDSAWRTGPIDDLAYGLELHVRAGVPAMDALVSATGRAAERIGLGTVTGTLRAGREADVIAVDGDPLADITAAARVAFVMRGGTIHRTAPAADGRGAATP